MLHVSNYPATKKSFFNSILNRSVAWPVEVFSLFGPSKATRIYPVGYPKGPFATSTRGHVKTKKDQGNRLRDFSRKPAISLDRLVGFQTPTPQPKWAEALSPNGRHLIRYRNKNTNKRRRQNKCDRT